MNVEMESNRSVKRIAMIDGNKLSFKAPSTSSLEKALLESGKLRRFGGDTTNARAHANSVTITMVARKAKGLFREIRNTEMPTPRIVSRAGFPISPILTKVTGSETMIPAFFKPMKVRKTPIPAAAAILISVGIALAIDSRIGVTRSEERRVGKE